MSADWRRLSRHADMRISDDRLEVVFGDDRCQTVFVDDESEDAIRVWSVVAKPAAVQRTRDAVLEAWQRNRLSELVGFTLDSRGRMIGESWVPTAGLTAEEWRFYVRALARACDRFEYLLTGRDEE